MTKEIVSLYYQDSRSDKFYVISIEEHGGKYSVPFTYGRRGTSGQSGIKLQGVSYEEAKEVYDKIVREKKNGHSDGTSQYHEEGKSMKTHAGIPEAKPTTADPATGSGKSSSVIDGGMHKRKIVWNDNEPAPVALPGKTSSGLLPQLLNEIQEEEIEKYINDDRYCAQEKHDGKRRMLRVSGSPNARKVEGINKKGLVVGYPADFEGACKSIADVNGIGGFTLDGEEVGETYFAFDLLSFNGEDLRNRIYEIRFKRLWNLTMPSSSVRVVETAYTTQDKRALYERLKKTGKEGIIFKLLNGAHKVGYSPDQVKFKFYATASVVVTGHNKKNSIAVAVWDPQAGSLVPVGNVTMIGHDRNQNPVGSICEVKFLYAYKGGSLYQPAYLGVRDDMDKEDCLITKLKFKATADEEDS